MLTAEQIAFYHENGYIVVEDVLSDDEVGGAAAGDGRIRRAFARRQRERRDL